MTWRGENDEPGRITRWRPAGWEIGRNDRGMLLWGAWCEVEAKATGRCVRRRVADGVEEVALFEGPEEES